MLKFVYNLPSMRATTQLDWGYTVYQLIILSFRNVYYTLCLILIVYPMSQ